MATLGREKEIGDFLESVQSCGYPSNKIEIIIVDQNDPEVIDLTELIKVYNQFLNIMHVKSLKKGLSLNRNIGLQYASGDIIAFPDDDCTYFNDTLKIVNEFFNNNCDTDLVMGRICDLEGNNSFRNWPRKTMLINRYNFYTKLSSITIFFRKKCFESIKFNENLGVGTLFGSCEDADVIYRTVIKYKSVYTPKVMAYHPDMDISTIDKNKFYSYGLGFGGFVRVNFDVYTLFLFFKVLLFHLIKMIVEFLGNNKENSVKRYYAFTSRIKGFIKYHRLLRNR